MNTGSKYDQTKNPKSIAVIGTGNVGGALATALSFVGHKINLGVRNSQTFKGQSLLQNPNTKLYSISDAVENSEVIILATPATTTMEVTRSLGDTSGKVIVDTMNTVMGRNAENFTNTTDAILAHTNTKDVVKCFNSTGYNNIINPIYLGIGLDMFYAGESKLGGEIVTQFAIEIGFENCYYVGGNDKFSLLESFALFWINLAMFQGLGREIGFKILNRK